MATATREHLLVRVDPPAARITLNRPEKRNALSLALMEELIAALEEVGADPEARAIVIEGAGPAFSAGHDLGEMVGRDAALLRAALRRLHGDDGDDPSPAAAGDRQGARHRDRGGLPARRRLRPRSGSDGNALRDARRQDRPVLLDADGSALPRGRAQARARAAAHRRADRRDDGVRVGADQRRRSGRGARRRRSRRWRRRSLARAR